METTSSYHPALTSSMRLEPMGRGQLRIHTATKDGKVIAEAFTLESLAHVLDMPMSTMDGRYARGKLAKWMVPIINGYGRPARGFPLQLLQDVITIITTKGACVDHDVNGSGPATLKPVRQANDLLPEYFQGKQFFTIPAIAYAFGFSETTIRKKLERSGLMRKFVDLTIPQHGGRPKRGISEKYLADVKLAITDSVSFVSGMDRALSAAGYAQARVDMEASIAPHTPPVPNSLRAWDRDTMAPAVPVNAVKSDDYPSEQVAQDLAAELEGLMGSMVLPDLPVVAAASPHHIPTPATEVTEDEHIIARRMWTMQVEALVSEVDEPTAADYRDTVDMLGLDKAAAERFIAEVKAARGTK